MDGLIAYVLSKGYTDEKISGLGNVFNYKGVVEHYTDLPATGNKKGDVWTVRDSGSEYVWVDTPNEHWELLGSSIGAGKYSTTINGDGTTTVFTIAHNLASRDVATIVYNATSYNEILVNITHTNENSVTLTFGTAPAVDENYVVTCLIPQGPQGPKGEKGDTGFSPSAAVSKVGRTATITITDSTGTTTAQVNDGNNEVSVSSTGTSTNQAKYITIDGVESKLGSAVSVSGTGTSTNKVKYITIDGTESKMGGDDVTVSATGTSTNDVRYITIDGTESRFTSVALRAMKSAWMTGTTAAAATAILNDEGVVAGDGFLATVYWSDLPGDLSQAEVKAFVMKKSGSYQKIIQFECTSGTVAPYSWFYNSYEGVWRSQVPLNNTVTSTSTAEALTANMGKALQDQISNLQNIGRFLSIWNSSTGLPETNPTVMPYTYRTGDYYRVGTVANKSQHIITLENATPNVNFVANINDASVTQPFTLATLWAWLLAHGYASSGEYYTNVTGLALGTIAVDGIFASSNGETPIFGIHLEDDSCFMEELSQYNEVTDTQPENKKPNGSTYDGTASTTVETETVEIGAVYYYDGSVWRMQAAGGGGLVQDVQVNGTSVLSAGTGVANVPLASGSAAGAMSTSDYTKLSGVASGAQVNVLEGVQVNGTDLTITDKKVNIPMASNTTYGAVKIGNWGAGHDTSGLFASPLTYSQYGNASQYNFIGKGTLENVLDNESVRFDKSTSLTDTQKTQARTNIGAGQSIQIEFLGESDS